MIKYPLTDRVCDRETKRNYNKTLNITVEYLNWTKLT